MWYWRSVGEQWLVAGGSDRTGSEWAMWDEMGRGRRWMGRRMLSLMGHLTISERTLYFRRLCLGGPVPNNYSNKHI